MRGLGRDMQIDAASQIERAFTWNIKQRFYRKDRHDRGSPAEFGRDAVTSSIQSRRVADGAWEGSESPAAAPIRPR